MAKRSSQGSKVAIKNNTTASKKPRSTKSRAPKKTTAVKSTPAPKITDVEIVQRHPLGHLYIEQALQQAGFGGGISTQKKILDTYSTDESIFSIKPQIVLQPCNEKDVEIAVTVISKYTDKFPSLSLTPRAAGTGLSGGSLTDSIVLDVSTHLTKIHDVKTRRGEHTITCQPGAMWRDVESRLKKERLYIPSYPASKDICTIGGAVGNNAAGPDSLRFGHCASWVAELDIVLHDGKTYTIKPLSYKEFKTLTKKKNALATIAKEVFELIQKNEKTIKNARPSTAKNTAGYALWDVLDVSVSQFKKGKGKFDLTQLIAGSQGTIGIVTSLTMRTEPIPEKTDLLVVPVFDLATAADVITTALTFKPLNIELFDDLTYDLALQNPGFFKDRLSSFDYYKVLLSMYTTYHVRYKRKIPVFTLLISLNNEEQDVDSASILRAIKEQGGSRARIITSTVEKEMFWQIRRASYTLSKFQDPDKRPAAFLEDMTVPPENISKFFLAVKKLLKKYNITAAVHGHGGNGHLHFYPLLDFTNQTTPALVEKMTEEFFATAVKHNGNICGEHNDGIIRTPHLNKIFNKKTLDLFNKTENIFDPNDIFNPGKKVNPRFSIKDNLRTTN